MNDKTAIEKAREALVSVSRIVDVLSLFDVGGATEGSIAYKVKEALAALDAEKPGEDAVSIREDIDSIREAVIKIGMNFMRSFMFAAEIDLIKFAASYHAEQCKACNKWISVKDRLPETIGDEWLVCDTDKKVFSGWYWPNSGWNDSEGSIAVSHWQPLPEAPLV